jgi:uncharacterized membrane protein
MRKSGEPFGHWFLNNLRKYFLSGLLVVVPIAATVLILAWVFDSVDNILNPTISRFFHISIPGLGVVATAVLVLVVGALASNYYSHKLIEIGDAILKRLPLFKQIYSGAKQVVEGISGTGAITKAAFREVVLVEFPTGGMTHIAFITNEFESETGQKYYAVYMPSTPVPWSGFAGIVPESMITRTNVSVDEALKIVISGAMIMPTIFEMKTNGKVTQTIINKNQAAHKANKKVLPKDSRKSSIPSDPRG